MNDFKFDSLDDYKRQYNNCINKKIYDYYKLNEFGDKEPDIDLYTKDMKYLAKNIVRRDLYFQKHFTSKLNNEIVKALTDLSAVQNTITSMRFKSFSKRPYKATEKSNRYLKKFSDKTEIFADAIGMNIEEKKFDNAHRKLFEAFRDSLISENNKQDSLWVNQYLSRKHVVEGMQHFEATMYNTLKQNYKAYYKAQMKAGKKSKKNIVKHKIDRIYNQSMEDKYHFYSSLSVFAPSKILSKLMYEYAVTCKRIAQIQKYLDQDMIQLGDDEGKVHFSHVEPKMLHHNMLVWKARRILLKEVINVQFDMEKVLGSKEVEKDITKLAKDVLKDYQDNVKLITINNPEINMEAYKVKKDALMKDCVKITTNYRDAQMSRHYVELGVYRGFLLLEEPRFFGTALQDAIRETYEELMKRRPKPGLKKRSKTPNKCFLPLDEKMPDILHSRF